jgi:dTDP-4-amino-4,6-dideoxygalactose transaminase
VFAEILPETFNIDPADVARKITQATKAVIPVHLFGQSADMTGLAAAASQLPIIEDAAQAIGAKHQRRQVGTLGAAGCFSFYPTKNLGGFGDGGIITTHSDELAERLRVLRDHGQQPRYYHGLVGINSRLDSIQAAVLGVKLHHLGWWAIGRERNATRYRDEFCRLGLDKHLGLPKVARGSSSVWNQYTVRVRGGRRDALLAHLTANKIGAAIYYPVPLHLQACFAPLGYRPGSLPATEQASAEVVSLPIYAELTQREQDRVIESIAQFCGVQYTPADVSRAA